MASGMMIRLCQNNTPVAVGTRSSQDDLYYLNIEVVPTTASALLSVSSVPLSTWHLRLGHISTTIIKLMESTNCVVGLQLSKSEEFPVQQCEGCAYGKSQRLSFPTSGHIKATEIGHLVHSDLCGPMSVASPSGAVYFLIFKDDYTGFRVLYFLTHKSQVFHYFQLYSSRLHTETNQHVKILRTDNGGEFTSSEFSNFLSKEGIKHETSAPHTPEQNGVAERENRIVMESARSLLHAEAISLELWAEAVACAVYCLNRALSTNNKICTPFEGWYKQKPTISHLRIFGIKAYVHIPEVERKKLDAKSKLCIFVGYSDTQKAYRFWCQETRKIVISRDAIFCEKEETVFPANPLFPEKISNELPSSTSFLPKRKNNVFPPSDISKDVPSPGDRRNPARVRHQAVPRSSLHALSAETSTTEPLSYDDAISSPDYLLWKQAMEEEMAALNRNHTWTLTTLPRGCSPVDCRWIYKLKHRVDGSIERYKARLVAKGFSQRPGIDYDQTFSPVVKYDSLRTILSVTAAEDLELYQLDVTTAFLHGVLKEEVYLRQPEGHVIPGQETQVYRLHKSLYGLKQASRNWNEKFDEFLTKFGLVPSQADSCVYFLRKDGEITIVSIWVDDGLVASSSKKIVLEIIEYLQLQFEIVSRPADLFVGLLINRNRDKKYLHLSQPTYISKILSKFCMQDCHSKATPADPFNRLTKESSTADSDSSKLFPFQEAVGSLLYCMITTRPDISYAVGQVAQFTTNPGKSHCEAVKRILSYLKGTSTYGLRFQKTQSNGILFAFTDADYAGDLDSRRSTTGYVLTLNAGPVAWGSIKQKSVALSTTEAEYIAACHTAKEIVWLRNLLHEIGFEQVDSTTLFCDNQSAVRLVFNPEFHKRTKHIDVQHHFIREKQNDGSLHMQYLPTEEQLADLFTKPLPGPRFEKLRRQIGIEDLLV